MQDYFNDLIQEIQPKKCTFIDKKEFDIEKFSPRFRFLMKGSMRRQHFTHDYTPEEHLPHAILIFSKYMFFIDYDRNCPSE